MTYIFSYSANDFVQFFDVGFRERDGVVCVCNARFDDCIQKILIFCLRLARERVNSLLCCLVFWSVISFCRFHLSDGIRCMPRYM